MKILFLTSRLPYPPYRGDKLKVWNLIRRVAKHHEVYLLSLIQRREEVELADALRPHCREIHLVHKSPVSSLFSCASAVFDSIPFQVAFFRSPEAREKLNEIIERVRPDAIHTHYIRMAQYTHMMQSLPRVLDLTDAFSLYLDRFSSATRNPIKRLLLKSELRRMIRYEPIIEKFNCSLVCSPVDRDVLLQRAPKANMELLYNGVDLETFTRDGEVNPDPFRIIFTGNMSYFPNSDGALFFSREIFPLIKKEVPEATLWIVGQNPPKKVLSLASRDIVVTGLVQDIVKEYVKSSVAVSPVRFGSGTLNKVLEPLALGIPVVSTSLGVAGLELDNGSDILIADDPKSFATHVVRVLTDKDLRENLAKRGGAKVRERYDWSAIVATLESVYSKIAKQGVGVLGS